MRSDRRAQSIEIAWSFVVLIGFALIYGFTRLFYDGLESAASDAVTNSTAQTGLNWTTTVYNALPVIAVVVSVLGAIALSVYQTRRL